MTDKQIAHVETLLIGFIERATKENATEAEIQALPYVAQSLVEIHET